MKTPFKTNRNRIGWLVLLFLIGITFQCKDDDPDPITGDHLPGLTYLGRGYDFFGEYADGNWVKNAMIDFDSYGKAVQAYGTDYVIPEEVDFLLTDRNDVTMTYGKTIIDYQKAFSTSLGISGSYLGFSASVNTSFDQTYTSNSEYSFLTVKNQVSRWRIWLPYEISTLRGMLRPDALADLDNLSPSALFQKYGHFLIREAHIGARADYNATARISSTFSEQDFKLGATMSYNFGVGKISSELSVEQQQQISTFQSQSNITCKTIGGASHLGGMNIISGDYDSWLATVENDPVLCDFTNNSLIPIWELTTDENRKTELKEYFESQVEENKFNPIYEDLVVGDITIVHVDRVSSLPADYPGYVNSAQNYVPGYHVIPKNLSCTGTYATFLAYKLVKYTPDVFGYYDLRINNYDGGEPAPAGYEVVPSYNGGGNWRNLNHGAGGIPIELLAKRVVSNDMIRRMMVVVDPTVGTPPEGYNWVLNDYSLPADLDWGKENDEGYKPMFLAYSRIAGD